MEILGKKQVIARLSQALNRLPAQIRLA